MAEPALTPPPRKPKPFPALPEPPPLARFVAADDLRAAIGLWLAWLGGERRASAHTLAAYGRDLAFFLDFLAAHLGETPRLATITQLRPADFRAYLAHRAGSVERVSVARGLSVVRSFIRFLERRHLATSPALAVLRAPKLPQGVPKPLTVADAAELIELPAAIAPAAWQGKRDIAVLTLLYGCGLRISEALGLRRAAAPFGETITILGKGQKQRLVPVLP
ncbi:MAG: site-specific integrase, partial [Thiohalocapsa sp.]